MKILSTFFPRILPYLPGCSEPLAAQALLTAAIEFCEASSVLRQNLASFNTTVGVDQYALNPPSNQHAIARVMSVAVDRVELIAGLAENIRNDLPVDTAKPRGFYTDRTDSGFSLRLSPPPDGVYPVVVAVALRPAIDATELDDDLYNIWVDPLVAGAISRCMLVPDQPFTNFPMARQMQDTAAKGFVASRIEGNYGLVRGSMRVKPRRFM